MYQSNGVGPKVLRQYSATGEYIRTLFPIPGDKPVSDYTGWGLNLMTSTDYSPKAPDWYGPLMTISPLSNYGRPNFLKAPSAGRLGILDDIKNTLWVINEDGTRNAAAIAETQTFITGPSFPGFKYGMSPGPRYFAGPPDRSYILMSGTSNATAGDTGFWRDGRIFKIDMATGAATVFYDLGYALPGAGLKYHSIHGIAVDDAGDGFACDRLKSFSVPIIPDDITWCPTTGAVYAIGKDNTIGICLYKIQDWRTETAVTINTALYGPSTALRNRVNGWYDRTYMTTSQSAEGTLIWYAYDAVGGIQLFKESGNAFVEYKSFSNMRRPVVANLKRMVVDPREETAYLVSSGSPVQRISDWDNPAFVPCSTLTGTGSKAALIGYDLAVDPYRRHLFVRQRGALSGPTTGPITRFSLGDYLAPAPLSVMGTHTVVDSYAVRGTMSVGTADFGIGVAPNGHLAFMAEQNFGSLTPTAIRYCPVYDTQTEYRPLMLQGDLGIGCGGVRFDLKGNLYVGLPGHSAGAGLPAVITSDPSWNKTIGTIHRYNAGGSLEGDLFTAAVTGSDKTYDVDFGQLGGGTISNCDCMTAMFGMDPWGRLYVPNGVFQKISVLDNEGNRLARFGTYGNIDNVNAEQTGAAGTAGRCYMAYPFAVDASDDFIYVSDPGNVMVNRFIKTFVLDNVPGMSTAALTRTPAAPLALSAFPNPFAARSSVRMVLPRGARLTLDVVDLAGRLVCRIASGPYPAGVHRFNWNGIGKNGVRAASGVYFLRLKSDAGNLVRRVVFAG
jgi:DNA-binding beta-propeller fold protein YncE